MKHSFIITLLLFVALMVSSCDKFGVMDKFGLKNATINNALNTTNCETKECSLDEPLLVTRKSKEKLTLKAQEELLCKSGQYAVVTIQGDTLSYHFKTSSALKSYTLCDKEITLVVESKKHDLSKIKYVKSPRMLYDLDFYSAPENELVQHDIFDEFK
ncbi:MAG: hypothetical protein OCC49_14845 [Fibrobacterales bacterium]